MCATVTLRLLPSYAYCTTHKRAFSFGSTLMHQAASKPWSKLSHRVWPRSFRGTVFTVLCVAQRLDRTGINGKSTSIRRTPSDPIYKVPLSIPTEVWVGSILPFLSRDDFRPNPPPPRITPKCAVCGTTKGVSSCSGCHVVYYCSRKHQAQAWKAHKKFCKKEKARQAREHAVLDVLDEEALHV